MDSVKSCRYQCQYNSICNLRMFVLDTNIQIVLVHGLTAVKKHLADVRYVCIKSS